MMSDLEERLQAWFASEVSRAERDLATSRVSTVRRRDRTPVPGLAVVGLSVALVLVAVALRPAVVPDAGLGPGSSPRSTPAASAKPDPTVGRFSDGIPGEIDGELVMRPEDLADNEFAGDAPFLLGGWHGQDRWFGCGRVGETHPLLDDCSPEWIGDAPARRGPILMQARELPEGPVVLRVHTNDVRSATCSEPERVRCAERLVVDELLWAGDAVTNSKPLQIGDVATVLDAKLEIGVEAVEIDRTCLRPMPPVIWRATDASPIGLILVYPTVEAREEAQRHPPFIAGCNGADVLIYVAPSAVVDNVVVYTKIDELSSDTERRALADSIAGWLREIPH